ncbi:hypothetical protein [uncultured Desulfovibrio sp.]|uniref:hypothetical protein n=3 Tax=Desulfovibrio TaxID=872 RepID=UPI00265FFCB4|nr:hypothetical protein [uncultured Desulfovibrio sp.]
MIRLNKIASYMLILFVCSCTPVKPRLPELKASTPVSTNYTTALEDLNMILEVYLPPEYEITFYYVKPIIDATGISQQGGEIPQDITSIVRDAVSQVYHKVRYVEQYDESDVTHLRAEGMLRQSSKLQTGTSVSIRPIADFTISGRISQFDRNIESTSSAAHGMGNFGEGLSRTDISASIDSSSRLSRIAVSFQVYDTSGISIPGKFGASAEVGFAKNGVDIGFAIFGNGFGYGSQATAMHGRHLALQMMAELSVVQIIGRTLTVPYWRIGSVQKIFEADRLVTSEWQRQYASMGPLLIPFMQSQCIACGDNSVMVTGQMDAQTQAALDRFADKFGVKNRSYPNYEMFKALEMHRLLDRGAASAAWAAYGAYKGGSRPVAMPQTARPAAPRPEPRSAPSSPANGGPAATPTAQPDVAKPLEGLL